MSLKIQKSKLKGDDLNNIPGIAFESTQEELATLTAKVSYEKKSNDKNSFISKNGDVNLYTYAIIMSDYANDEGDYPFVMEGMGNYPAMFAANLASLLNEGDTQNFRIGSMDNVTGIPANEGIVERGAK